MLKFDFADNGENENISEELKKYSDEYEKFNNEFVQIHGIDKAKIISDDDSYLYEDEEGCTPLIVWAIFRKTVIGIYDNKRFDKNAVLAFHKQIIQIWCRSFKIHKLNSVGFQFIKLFDKEYTKNFPESMFCGPHKLTQKLKETYGEMSKGVVNMGFKPPGKNYELNIIFNFNEQDEDEAYEKIVQIEYKQTDPKVLLDIERFYDIADGVFRDIQ